MQTAFLKFIDNYLGRLVIAILRPQPPSHIVEPGAVLIIRPGGIGDAILLIPTIKALRNAYPACAIDILAERRNAATFHLASGIRTIYLYDTLAGLKTVLRSRYDAVIDTEQWHLLSAGVARLTKSPLSIGYATNERIKMFTNAVQYSLEEYEMDSFSHLLQPLGIMESEIGKPPFLVVPDEAVTKATAMLGKFADKPFIAIFPGSSIPEKRWNMSNFVELALKLNQAGFQIIVIGSEKERVMGEAMTCGLDALNLVGKTSLVETAAVIDKSALLVSGDSGILHIAAGLGRPTVSLFGPSCIKKWAPRGEHHLTISRNLSCSPCSQFGNIPNCRINVRCMAEITVEEVLGAVEKLLIGNHSGI
jgi:lipopolysaccharide heptosyltransferase II